MELPLPRPVGDLSFSHCPGTSSCSQATGGQGLAGVSTRAGILGPSQFCPPQWDWLPSALLGPGALRGSYRSHHLYLRACLPSASEEGCWGPLNTPNIGSGPEPCSSSSLLLLTLWKGRWTPPGAVHVLVGRTWAEGVPGRQQWPLRERTGQVGRVVATAQGPDR